MKNETEAAPHSLLERLPLLALELICEYLSFGDLGRRSLFAFSQTSRRCCIVTERERFERILLDARGQQQIKDTLACWNNILSLNNRNRHVRRIKIIGSMMIDAEESKPGWSEYHTGFLRRELEKHADEINQDLLGENDAFSILKQFGQFDGSEPKCTDQNKARSNEAWGPVAIFIRTFSGLKELFWASTDQVPRCIMDTLHDSLPRTRLHVHTFSLRSLYQKHDNLCDIDPDEYVLASSPNLSSICVPSTMFDSHGNIEYNEEAAQHMAAGIAPNLQSVTMYIQTAGNSPYLLAALRSGRPPWRGFFANKEDDVKTPKAGLERLAFYGTHHERLPTWSAYTDLSILRSLDLQTIISAEYLEKLTKIAERGVFSNLKTLSIRLGYDNEETGPHRPLAGWATAFFSTLPLLNGLQVRNPMAKETTAATLARHGASLRILHLDNMASPEDVREIRNACPNLRNLHIGVRRSAGDKQEVLTYKILGSFSRLEILSLDLHITYDLTKEEESDQERVAQQIRSELINAAIDSELAQAIFRVIFEANHATRQGILSSFQQLTIRGVGHHDWEYDFTLLTDWLARSWFCENQRVYTEGKKFSVRELGVGHRKSKDVELNLQRCMKDNFRWCHGGKLIRPTWEAIWPESKRKDEWIHFWHSMPLDY